MEANEIADCLNTLNSFKVSANKDQIEKHDDLVEGYNWRVHLSQPNRIWVNFQNKIDALELVKILQERKLIWLKNWLND